MKIRLINWDKMIVGIIIFLCVKFRINAENIKNRDSVMIVRCCEFTVKFLFIMFIIFFMCLEFQVRL